MGYCEFGNIAAAANQSSTAPARGPRDHGPSCLFTDPSKWPTQLPDDIATLKAMVIAAERKASDRGLEIEALKLTIAKLQRNTFGASSESGKKLLDQLELQLAELEEGMAEDKATAAIATHRASATADKGEDGQHRKPARRPPPAICRASASCMRHRPAVPVAAGA
jgi:hypothetical protein